MASKDDDERAGGADEAVGAPQSPSAKDARTARPKDNHVGIALRSAYDEAVREDVPAEFLDLLGKLS